MTRSCSSTIAATCRSLWVSTPPTIRHTPSMTAIPSLQVDRASMASPGPNAWTGQSRDHEGKDLLGSHASARQSLTARRSRAVDRSGERHGWSISVWVRPHRAPRGASLTGWSIAMRAGPPGNWRLSSDYHSEHVLFAAIEILRPKYSPTRGLDQLHGDQKPFRPARHRPAGDVLDVEAP